MPPTTLPQPRRLISPESPTPEDATQIPPITIGILAESSPQFTTKDNADHAGLSLPLKPSSHTGLLPEILLLNYPWNKSFLATLLDKTKVATEDSHLELTNTLKTLEELNHTLITHTLLKEVNLELATSNLPMLFAPSPDTTALTEKLDCTNKLPLLPEVPSQSALMLPAGKTITVVSCPLAETVLITASNWSDTPTTETAELIGSLETHGEIPGERTDSSGSKSDKIYAQSETMPPLSQLPLLKSIIL